MHLLGNPFKAIIDVVSTSNRFQHFCYTRYLVRRLVVPAQMRRPVRSMRPNHRFEPAMMCFLNYREGNNTFFLVKPQIDLESLAFHADIPQLVKHVIGVDLLRV